MKKIITIILLFLSIYIGKAQEGWGAEYTEDTLCLYCIQDGNIIMYPSDENTTIFALNYLKIQTVVADDSVYTFIKKYYKHNNSVDHTTTAALLLIDSENIMWGNTIPGDKNTDLEWLSNKNNTIIYEFLKVDNTNLLIEIRSFNNI